MFFFKSNKEDRNSPIIKLNHLEFQILPMVLDDLDEVLAIENVSYPYSPWPYEFFESELVRKRTKFFVAKSVIQDQDKDNIFGYIVFGGIANYIHIFNVAVHPAYRRMGIASELIKFTVQYARKSGKNMVILDVRENNHIAINLYRKLGFKQISIREGYYPDTGEDALVMVKLVK